MTKDQAEAKRSMLHRIATSLERNKDTLTLKVFARRCGTSPEWARKELEAAGLLHVVGLS